MASEAGDGQRKLGFWMCTALVVGNTIGIGIFLLPASLAPYGFNATLGWLVTAIGCVAIARVFARLAREMPNADGPYGYIRSTLGDIPGFSSFRMMEIVERLESDLGVEFAAEDLVPEKLTHVDGLCRAVVAAGGSR